MWIPFDSPCLFVAVRRLIRVAARELCPGQWRFMNHFFRSPLAKSRNHWRTRASAHFAAMDRSAVDGISRGEIGGFGGLVLRGRDRVLAAITDRLSPRRIERIIEHNADADLGKPVAGQRFQHLIARLTSRKQCHEQEGRIGWPGDNLVVLGLRHVLPPLPPVWSVKFEAILTNRPNKNGPVFAMKTSPFVNFEIFFSQSN